MRRMLLQSIDRFGRRNSGDAYPGLLLGTACLNYKGQYRTIDEGKADAKTYHSLQNRNVICSFLRESSPVLEAGDAMAIVLRCSDEKMRYGVGGGCEIRARS